MMCKDPLPLSSHPSLCVPLVEPGPGCLQ